MNGLLIIDKAQGMTSHDVVRRIRRLLQIRRVGHAGTLDPMATGLLQVAVGEATRLVEFLMAGEKSYRATLKLGEITDTQDAEGSVVERRPLVPLQREQIEAACRGFVGPIRQLPPMYSALKRQGTALHKLARQGIEVERAEREIVVHRLQIIEVDLPLVTIEVDCSKGTYIRTLAHDIGQTLGPGAHLVALRRIRTGAFNEDDAVPLSLLETRNQALERLLALPDALRGMTAVQVGDSAIKRLCDGIPPTVAEIAGDLPVAGETVMLMQDAEVRSIARFAPERCREQRGDFELLRVFHATAAG